MTPPPAAGLPGQVIPRAGGGQAVQLVLRVQQARAPLISGFRSGFGRGSEGGR
jgi:hypothetical protein